MTSVTKHLKHSLFSSESDNQCSCNNIKRIKDWKVHVWKPIIKTMTIVRDNTLLLKKCQNSHYFALGTKWALSLFRAKYASLCLFHSSKNRSGYRKYFSIPSVPESHFLPARMIFQSQGQLSLIRLGGDTTTLRTLLHLLYHILLVVAYILIP